MVLQTSFVNPLTSPSILSEIGNTAKNLDVMKVPILVYLPQYIRRDVKDCFPSCSGVFLVVAASVLALASS